MSTDAKRPWNDRTASLSLLMSRALPKFCGLMLAGLAVMAASLLAQGQSPEQPPKANPVQAEGRVSERLRKRAAKLADRISGVVEQAIKVRDSIVQEKKQVESRRSTLNQARLGWIEREQRLV